VTRKRQRLYTCWELFGNETGPGWHKLTGAFLAVVRLLDGPPWWAWLRRWLHHAALRISRGRWYVLPDPVGITQIKEKYGSLRIYAYGPAWLQTVIDALEAESAHVCEHCGRRGRVRCLFRWYATRCPQCAYTGDYPLTRWEQAALDRQPALATATDDAWTWAAQDLEHEAKEASNGTSAET